VSDSACSTFETILKFKPMGPSHKGLKHPYMKSVFVPTSKEIKLQTTAYYDEPTIYKILNSS